MPKLSEEIVSQRVFENSLNTCEYVAGYKNSKSTITVKCIVHNFEFETRYENVARDNRKHHICPKCQKEDLENGSTKIECECAYCHSKFKRAPSELKKSKSGLFFCCREHKDLAQRIESGDNFNLIRPEHYDKGINYREKAFRNFDIQCAVCFWNEDIDCLEVHHIDENRQNNDLSNLIILCPLCHKKLTTHKYKLIDKKFIKKII